MSVRPVLRTNDFDAAVDACLRSLGHAQFLCHQVDALISTRKLKRLLDFEPAPLPIHLVYPHARHVSANVRAFIDSALPRAAFVVQPRAERLRLKYTCRTKEERP